MGVCGCDCVGEGVCGWYSLDCCLKVHVCTCRCVSGEGGVCVCGGGEWVGEEGSVWVGQSSLLL